jgi:hypothetical protein
MTLFYKSNYYGEGGLITDVTTLFITQAILPFVLDVINVGYQIGTAKRYYALKKGQESTLT